MKLTPKVSIPLRLTILNGSNEKIIKLQSNTIKPGVLIQLIFLSITIASSSHLMAQAPIYTGDDFVELADNEMFTISTASLVNINDVDFTTTGENTSWDYSFLQISSQRSRKYIDPKEAGYYSFFACGDEPRPEDFNFQSAYEAALVQYNNCIANNPNLALRLSDDFEIGTVSFGNWVNHYNKSSSQFSLQSFGASYSINGQDFQTYVAYDQPDTLYQFPFTFGDSFSNIGGYQLGNPLLGFEYDYQINREVLVEGYGELITPYQTFANALKVKTLVEELSTTIIGEEDPIVISLDKVIYEWFVKGEKIPVLTVNVTVENEQQIITSVSYLDAFQCTDPTALFSPSAQSFYLDENGEVEATFNNISSGANEYIWDFGDGSSPITTNEPTNITHTYTQAGEFTIHLTARNNACDPIREDQQTVNVTVIDDLVADFYYTPQSICAGEEVSFFDASSANATTYHWDFGDGAGTSTEKSPKYTFTSGGTYEVTLTASNAAISDMATQTIFVAEPLGNITIAENAQSACATILTASPQNPDPETTYTWYKQVAGGDDAFVGTGNPIDVDESGDYYAIARNNCGEATSNVLTINLDTPPPTAIEVTGNLIFQEGSSVTLSAPTGNYNYSWRTSPDEQEVGNERSLEVTTSGTFYVVVTDNATGCTATSETITTVRVGENTPPTIADQTFILAENSDNGTSVGTIVAEDADEDALTFSITAGNDEGVFALESSTGALTVSDNTNLDFETTPSYALTVSVADGNGGAAEATITMDIIDVDEIAPTFTSVQEVSVAENITGTAYTATADEPVTFTLGSSKDESLFTLANNNELSFTSAPDFENPLDGDANNIYLVEITATDAMGNATTLEVAITVTDTDENTPPTIADQTFSLAENSDNGTSVGTIVAEDADDDALTFSITAGNEDGVFAVESTTGALTVLDNTNLDFETTPSYALTVSVADGNGGAAEATITIDITATPQITVDFSADETNIATGGSVKFTNLSSGQDLTYAWSFPGGNPSASTEASPEVIYSLPGTYDVTLTVTDAFGTSASETKLAYLTVSAPQITVDFSADETNIATGGSVKFTNLSSGQDLTYAWSFPGGNPSASTEASPEVIYSLPGTYDVTLTVTDAFGTSMTEVKEAYISVEAVLGISEGMESTVTLFPNPSIDFLFLELTETTHELNVRSVIDLHGNQQPISYSMVQNQKWVVDIHLLSKGVYILHLEGKEGKCANIRFIKK